MQAVKGARFAHASLAVEDVERSAAFLIGVLGFRVTFGPVEIGPELARMTGSDCGDSRLVQLEREADGAAIELVQSARGGGRCGGAMAHIALEVPNLEHAVAAAGAAGAVLAGEITDFAEGRAVYMRAPGGAVIEFEELFQ